MGFRRFDKGFCGGFCDEFSNELWVVILLAFRWGDYCNLNSNSDYKGKKSSLYLPLFGKRTSKNKLQKKR